MNVDPLNEQELDFVTEVLLEFGNDDSILNASELDGFLTALVSGPEAIMPSQWIPELWGGAGNDPEWRSEEQMQRFMALLMQHMNNCAFMLMEHPAEFEALFNVSHQADEEVLIAEEWCFGYMRGVRLGAWPPLPEGLQSQLEAIALHGLEDNFDAVHKLSLEEHQRSVVAIEPAARALHAHWLAQRSRPQQPVVSESKVGRNDACPCGSGKKYKKCCLH